MKTIGTLNTVFLSIVATSPDIASMLKLHTLEFAQQYGYAEIATTTASPVMLALNERLGFRQDWAEVRLVKVMKDA